MANALFVEFARQGMGVETGDLRRPQNPDLQDLYEALKIYGALEKIQKKAKALSITVPSNLNPIASRKQKDSDGPPCNLK